MMISIREIREFLAALAGALLTISVYLVLRAALSNTSDADWLNFAAVIFGVVLTIGVTKAIDILLEGARQQRKKDDFVTAVRSVAMALTDCAEASRENIILHVRAAQSLWRVAEATIDQLPDLDFDHRAKIGIMQDGLGQLIPQLVSYSQIATTTNPELYEPARQIARDAALTVLPVTELFGKASVRIAANANGAGGS